MTDAINTADASPDGVPAALAIAETRAWVRRAVIGLNYRLSRTRSWSRTRPITVSSSASRRA